MVLVILFQDLPVGIEQPRGEEDGEDDVERLPARPVLVPEPAASRVAGRAAQVHEVPVGEPRRLHGEREVLHRQPGHGRRLGPFHVQGARPMAGLAAHGDLAPGGLVGVVLRIVPLADPRGVALRAHHVPVLGRPGPVEPVRRGDDLVGVQRVPALLLDVPGDGEGLQPPAGKGDEVLLEREPPEGVGHLELPGLAVGAFGVHEVLPVFSGEPCGLPLLREGGIVEVAQDGVLAGRGHRQGVVRAAPLLVRRLVAGLARVAADVEGRGAGRLLRAAGGHHGQAERHGEDDGEGRQHPHDLPPPQGALRGVVPGLRRSGRTVMRTQIRNSNSETRNKFEARSAKQLRKPKQTRNTKTDTNPKSENGNR